MTMDELAPKHYELDRMVAICEALQKDTKRLKGEVAKTHWLKEQAERKLAAIEVEHGQELQGMRSFSMDLEARLEEAERVARQEAKRANNAALRAERNALRIKELAKEAIMNCALCRHFHDVATPDRTGQWRCDCEGITLSRFYEQLMDEEVKNGQ